MPAGIVLSGELAVILFWSNLALRFSAEPRLLVISDDDCWIGVSHAELLFEDCFIVGSVRRFAGGK